MEIKVFGIRLNYCKSVGLDPLWNAATRYSDSQIRALGGYLSSDLDELPELLEKGRLIVISPYDKNYRAGIVLKIRDAKSVFELRGKDGKMTVGAKELESGQKSIELNFFLMRSDTGIGLYAHYHHSTHMNDFGGIFKRLHESLLKKEKDAVEKRKKNKEIDAKEAKRLKNELRSLTYDILTRRANAEDLIQQMNEIKKVRVSFLDWGPQVTSHMAPVVSEAKQATAEISFGSDANLQAIKSGILSWIKQSSLRKLAVRGTDPDQLERVINLDKNFDDFDRIDYDSLASSMKDVDLTDLKKSWTDAAAFKWLKKIAEKDDVAKRLSQKQ